MKQHYRLHAELWKSHWVELCSLTGALCYIGQTYLQEYTKGFALVVMADRLAQLVYLQDIE